MSVHLHVRSCYTLLKSTVTISKLIQSAKQHGDHAVALCDKHVMHGAMEFYHAAIKENIKPIFGMEVDALEKDALFGFILLAKDDQGYQDLMKLSTILNTSERKQTIILDELLTYTHHCIVLTNGDQNQLETYLLKDEQAAIYDFLQVCKQSFQTFYVSIARNDSPLLCAKNKILKAIAHEVGLPTVALSRIYFNDEEDEESYKTLCAIDQGVVLEDKMLNYSPKRFYRSHEQMQALYDQEDLDATEEIAAQCNVEMNFEKAILPKYKNRYGVSSEQFLTNLCHKGLEKRMQFHAIPDTYKKRLAYELDVIISMGYADYFLIVWDFIRFARSKDIYIGPGRGSAAGSLVAYCLGITHVDPIRYHLLFERFLNPSRVSMPDIDTDFPDNRRDEVIEHVHELYGDRRVSHIITFNTLAAKQVLRDVGKVMQIPPRQIDFLCKLVPNRPKVVLEDAYNEQIKFKQMINSGEKMRKLYDISQRLEGLPRHTSLHAAGIVLSNDEIYHHCPLIDVDEGMSATQFTMEYLEELGLIKMDFLGLRNLTIIDEIVHHINEKEKRLDIMRIPLDDQRTFQLIQQVDTVGVFQLESEGMKNLLRKMQPNCFEDIVATIALFRPGPMENIPYYLECRKHPENVQYLHPSLKPILQDTYGVIIYQEQVMRIAQSMAGFTLGEADNLRKAISKKKSASLQKLQDAFIQGAIHNGVAQDTAQQVYDLIMKFANYGYNRSHSVAYGMISYQMAYLKANAPLYFFTSLLNSVIGSETKTSEYVFEAKRRKIQILLPSVNHSENVYTIEQHALRFPLIGIKGIGTAVSNVILEERRLRHEFKDFFDFVARMEGNKVGKKTIELLIYAGALDEFKINRSSMIASLDDAIRYGNLVKIEDQSQVLFDFNLVSKPVLTSIKENAGLRAEKEKEMLGFYLSTHPIATMRESMKQDLVPLISLPARKNSYVKFICMVEKTKQYRTKNGHLMMFVVAGDETGKFDLVCMPNIYEMHMQDLVKGNYLYVEGVIDKETSCLVKKISKLERFE